VPAAAGMAAGKTGAEFLTRKTEAGRWQSGGGSPVGGSPGGGSPVGGSSGGPLRRWRWKRRQLYPQMRGGRKRCGYPQAAS